MDQPEILFQWNGNTVTAKPGDTVASALYRSGVRTFTYSYQHGRPRGLLQVNPGYGYVIGVDVGETAFLVELFDFGLNLRARHASVTDMSVLDPEDAVSPAPRSQTRSLIWARSMTCASDILARSGKIGWLSSKGPTRERS